jgi:hypothetical protein
MNSDQLWPSILEFFSLFYLSRVIKADRPLRPELTDRQALRIDVGQQLETAGDCARKSGSTLLDFFRPKMGLDTFSRLGPLLAGYRYSHLMTVRYEAQNDLWS